jgi:hexosaminidase
MKPLLALVLSLASLLSHAQELSIIPQPAKIRTGKDSFRLNKTTVIVIINKADEGSAAFLNNYLQAYYGFTLKTTKPKAPPSNFILLSTWNDTSLPVNKEAYQLIVDKKFIAINANNHAGTFYGVQSLIQLLPVNEQRSKNNGQRITNPKFPVPCAVIEDEPRFSYRGMHLDVGRHFFPVSFIKQYIDYLALHKFNTFHWHLTEDQGWRVQIKKYPKLTSVLTWRSGTIIGRYPGKGNDSIPYGGFYTQEEIKEVVKYAASRFITVIPEIEMPGHSSAAIAAYPELSCFPGEDTKPAKGTAWAGLTKGKQVQQAWGVFDDIFCAGNDNTFNFLEGVLDEVIQLFPSKYIHIGGDEAPKTHWKRCPKCQQRIKDLGLKDEHGLQSYFIQRIEKYLNSKGKQVIGWDEILEGGLAPNATVMSWQGEKGGIEAAKQNHDVVMTPGNWCYFDHSQSRNEDSVTIGGFTPVEEVYSYEPVPPQLTAGEAKHILGAQANVWTEYMMNTRKVEYQVFPRIAAMSEVLWTQKENKDSADFERRLMQQFKRYDMWKVNYSKAFFALKAEILPTADNTGIVYKLFSKYKAGIISTNNPYGSARDENFYKYKEPLLLNQSTRVTSILWDTLIPKDPVRGYVLNELTQNFYFNKATGKEISTNIPPSPSYPGNGGAFGLVNGVRADKFANTEWLGWNGKEVEIEIDFGKPDMIHEIVLHVWKQEASWIYLPQKIELEFYYKNGNTDEFNSMEIEQPEEGWGEDRDLKFTFDPKMVTSVKIRLTPLMKIPEGRQGAGHAAWIFLDEIEIN